MYSIHLVFEWGRVLRGDLWCFCYLGVGLVAVAVRCVCGCFGFGFVVCGVYNGW